MHRIDLQPLSQNQAWKGRRYSTSEYKLYADRLRLEFRKLDLPKIDPKQRFCLFYEFGITDRQDVSNGVKCFEDQLCKYLGVNDRKVVAFYCRKKIVKRPDQYIRFQIFADEYSLLRFLQEEL